MNRIRLVAFLGLSLFFITIYSVFSYSMIFGATNDLSWTIIDDNLEIYIVVEGVNVREADNRLDAIMIDPNGTVTAHINITSIADSPIDLEELKIAFFWANLDAFTVVQELNTTIHPGNTLSANQTFIFEDYIDFVDLPLISGIYKFRYNIDYSVNNSKMKIVGDPFYMKIVGNPLETVTGAVSTIAVASSGISLLWVANSVRKISPVDFRASVDSSYAAPTNKLLSFYKGKSYKSIQNEISNAVYRRTTAWKADECPVCSTVWPENSDKCVKCKISFEQAQKIYLEALENKSIVASKEIVDSVSGLSLYNIAQDLSDNVIPATSIISVLTSAGLTLVEPRVSSHMSKKTRRLIFTSLSTALLSVLWIQAVGYEVVSLTMLLIAILTGTIPAMLIRRALELNLKKKISDYFIQNTIES